MSKQNNPKASDTPKASQTGSAAHAATSAKVVTLHEGSCMADSCKKSSQKAGFCMEHFDWFKEGLITKEGHKPSDFEKKFYNYQKRCKPAA